MNALADPSHAVLARALPEQLRDRADREAWRHWNTWHVQRLGRPLSLPVDPRRVLQFIEDHARWRLQPESPEAQRWLQALRAAHLTRGNGPAYAGSTMRRRLQALARWHRVQGLPDPLDTVRIQAALALMRKGAWPRTVQLRAMPTPPAQPSACGPAALRDQALRALVALGPPLGGRRLAQLRFDDLEPGSALMELLEPCPRADLDAALVAVRRWQVARGPGSDRVFCHVGADGRFGPALSAAEIRHLLRHAATAAPPAG